jgi:hypothetical protein
MRLPSKNTICGYLGLNDAQGNAVRKIVERNPGGVSDYIREDMAEIADIIGAYGISEICSKQDGRMFAGLTYANTGETYKNTVIFDHGKRQWIVGNWGDMVERDNGRRFV